MKIKIAIAAALFGCQLFGLAACARDEADKRIDSLLLAPLGKVAQMDGATPNGLPYVPPEERQADSGAPFARKAAGRPRHSSGHKRSGKHHKKLSSAHRRNQTAAAPSEEQGTCCASEM